MINVRYMYVIYFIFKTTKIQTRTPTCINLSVDAINQDTTGKQNNFQKFVLTLRFSRNFKAVVTLLMK